MFLCVANMGNFCETRRAEWQNSCQFFVTTQVVPDSESTCGTAVCVVSLNTNLSNLTNRAELNLQVGGNSIRVSFNTNLSNFTNRAG